MKAFVFPGQGSQFPGMGKELYQSNPKAKELMDKANEVLGFEITKVMFEGTADDLKRTEITQPAIFIHSVVNALCSNIDYTVKSAVAGHSLGEFSALVVSGAMSFEDGLRLVQIRATQMQKCCETTPGGMAAVIGLGNEQVEEICAQVEGTVIAANYNCDGQLVISGENQAIEKACELLKAAGARRALPLAVSGAFHSPLMQAASEELAKAIQATPIKTPVFPIYQNVSAKAETDPEVIKANLLAQLTSPVRWTQSVKAMLADGVDSFTEIGPGTVLQGLVKRISSACGVEVEVLGIQ